MIRGLLRARRKRRDCFHHDHLTGETWLAVEHVSGGRRLWFCTRCGRTWLW